MSKMGFEPNSSLCTGCIQYPNGLILFPMPSPHFSLQFRLKNKLIWICITQVMKLQNLLKPIFCTFPDLEKNSVLTALQQLLTNFEQS